MFPLSPFAQLLLLQSKNVLIDFSPNSSCNNNNTNDNNNNNNISSSIFRVKLCDLGACKAVADIANVDTLPGTTRFVRTQLMALCGVLLFFSLSFSHISLLSPYLLSLSLSFLFHCFISLPLLFSPPPLPFLSLLTHTTGGCLRKCFGVIFPQTTTTKQTVSKTKRDREESKQRSERRREKMLERR